MDTVYSDLHPMPGGLFMFACSVGETSMLENTSTK